MSTPATTDFLDRVSGTPTSLVTGAAAVSGGRADHPAFRRYLPDVAGEVAANGLVPVFCGACLPEQVPVGPVAHFLALTCDAAVPARRIEQRGGRRVDVAKHVRIDRLPRTAEVTPPRTMTVGDTTTWTAAETVARALARATAASRGDVG